MALSLEEALALRRDADASGKILSVNQNMRYDQAMRVLKQIIDAGELGEIVFAQIDMHAIPHWQGYLSEYDRLTLANMSVHHLDVLRFLFGEAEEITTVTRRDRRLDPAFPFRDARDDARGRLVRSPRGGLRGRPAHPLAGRWHRGCRQGHDRLAARRAVHAELRVRPDDGRRMGHAGMEDQMVSARLHRRDGTAAACDQVWRAAGPLGG
jgi:predicted dehydrogenase